MAGVPRSDEILADMATALSFFTRLPVPFSTDAGRSLSQSLWAAPLAGLAVALTGWLAFIVALWLGLFTDIAALVALGAMLVVTGALHEDGLADIADGFGGGREREAKLAIMRDSRIGTYGVCALTLSLIARWLAPLQDRPGSPEIFVDPFAAKTAPLSIEQHYGQHKRKLKSHQVQKKAALRHFLSRGVRRFCKWGAFCNLPKRCWFLFCLTSKRHHSMSVSKLVLRGAYSRP